MILKKLFFDENGQGMSEYGLILGLVAVASVTALSVTGKNIKNVFNGINSALEKANIIKSVSYSYSPGNGMAAEASSCSVDSGSVSDMVACYEAKQQAALYEIYYNGDNGDMDAAHYWEDQSFQLENACATNIDAVYYSGSGQNPCHRVLGSTYE